MKIMMCSPITGRCGHSQQIMINENIDPWPGNPPLLNPLPPPFRFKTLPMVFIQFLNVFAIGFSLSKEMVLYQVSWKEVFTPGIECFENDLCFIILI